MFAPRRNDILGRGDVVFSGAKFVGVSSRRPRRAALFIDFDNVKSRMLAQLAGDVLAILARGEGDPDRPRRRFAAKIVYWNVREGGNRQEKIDAFIANGFEFKATNSIVSEKSTADTMIAFDIGDLVHRRPRVDEFILMSSDSDFLPVLERLHDMERRVTVFARKSDTSEAYWNGELTIADLDDLIGAARARAQERRNRERRFSAMLEAPGRWLRAGLKSLSPMRIARRMRRETPEAAQFDTIDALADDIVAEMRKRGVSELNISTLARVLSKYPDFESQGAATRVWFGFGSHHDLMRAIVGARDDLRVRQGPRRGRRRTLKLVLVAAP